MTIRDLLETVEWRLEETIEAFTVMRTINEHCNIDVNPAIHKAINDRAGFWKPVTVGLQTTVIIGINAILDKERSDSATLYLVHNKLKAKLPLSFPLSFEHDLDTIHNRYKKFRHKLFAHNDKKREAIVNDFDQAGFSWDSLATDLSNLEYAFKVLWHVMGDQPIPDKATAKTKIYPYVMSVIRTTQDTSALLACIAE